MDDIGSERREKRMRTTEAVSAADEIVSANFIGEYC